MALGFYIRARLYHLFGNLDRSTQSRKMGVKKLPKDGKQTAERAVTPGQSTDRDRKFISGSGSHQEMPR